MTRPHISLKARVRYDGRVRIFDRRATRDTDLEKIPNPLWRTVSQVLRTKFNTDSSVSNDIPTKP
jgi:hypothetical protein